MAHLHFRLVDIVDRIVQNIRLAYSFVMVRKRRQRTGLRGSQNSREFFKFAVKVISVSTLDSGMISLCTVPRRAVTVAHIRRLMLLRLPSLGELWCGLTLRGGTRIHCLRSFVQAKIGRRCRRGHV